jgi:Nucleotidyl transferase AbiEii toxin, Type IV TA system
MMTNASVFTPCMQTLPEAQRKLWPQLRAAHALGFVLYGDTAIALRLGHRTSIDFDFFSESPLNKAEIIVRFPFIASATTIQEGEDTLTVLVNISNEPPVKVSFFSTIDFGRIGAPQMTTDSVMLIASLEDLLATKLKVIMQRVEAKDYRDIAAILDTGVALYDGLGGANALLGKRFQPSECLKALVYFEGGDLSDLSAAEKLTLKAAVAKSALIPTVQIISKSLGIKNAP